MKLQSNVWNLIKIKTSIDVVKVKTPIDVSLFLYPLKTGKIWFSNVGWVINLNVIFLLLFIFKTAFLLSFHWKTSSSKIMRILIGFNYFLKEDSLWSSILYMELICHVHLDFQWRVYREHKKSSLWKFGIPTFVQIYIQSCAKVYMYRTLYFVRTQNLPKD